MRSAPSICRNLVFPALLMATAAFALLPVRTDAFPLYSVGCVDCHSEFQGNGALHQMHVGPTAITNECMLCHSTAPVAGDAVFTYQSGIEGGQGCRGCHGRDPGSATGWGAGLRVLHDVMFGGLCASCHALDTTPPGEDTLPVYYGRADVAVSDPCEMDPLLGGEDWNGDGVGLDNDGDGLADGDDSDCATIPVSAPPEVMLTTWGRLKSMYVDRALREGSR